MFGSKRRRPLISKGFEDPPENTISTQREPQYPEETTLEHPTATPAEPPTQATPQPDFNEGDLKEAMGFDRDDPNVMVTMMPLGDRRLVDVLDGIGINAEKGTFDTSYRPGNVEEHLTGNAAAMRSLADPFANVLQSIDQRRVDDLKADPVRTARNIAASLPKLPGIAHAIRDLLNEIALATAEHGPMKSGHEGYGVILEELDKLWDHVKANTVQSPEARQEAIQLAAMAIRFVVDVIEDKPEGGI